MTRTTTRLCAAVLAATTGFALVACGSDDAEDTSTTDQTAAETTANASTPTGDNLDDLSLLSPGESIEVSNDFDDAVYSLTVDNSRTGDAGQCVDVIWTLVAPPDEQTDDNLNQDQDNATLTQLYTDSGSPLAHISAGMAHDGVLDQPEVDTTVVDAGASGDSDGDSMFDTAARTVTQGICADAADADTMVVSVDVDDTPSQEVDGWRVDL
ncbi:hypothetical protein [Corynebacterium glyciniphilum]|uniref:hypothetical protein n=1 Tax=Corynebacterium glyciniphilum TaxID=1404244 RepID=UPI0011AB86AD|nr:hypothetical protein [Corynebacterium glyciniphilum]